MRKKDNRPPKENRPPMPPTPPYPPYPNKRPKPFKPHNHRAHFAPPLMQYHIPHAFKFWCNQTLPFVYDDSLSFYELLNKVVHYMNNMFEDEKLMTVNIGELAEAYKMLEQFVNDYFSFYQSKGLIVFDVPVTNANYREILPDCDTAQMNTIYRLLFVEDSTQNIPANLPDDAKPFSDSESLLINISNFKLKFVGGVWQQPPVEENETATENPNMIGNYQLLITDRNFFIRQHNGDTWGEWESIFGNWYAEIWEQIKEYIDTQDEAVREELLQTIEDAVDDLTELITAETNRATAAENALGLRIDANVTAITNEINRAMAAENDLSARITAEVNRATAAEDALDDKIEDEIDAREAADTALSNTITAETTRATAAENDLSSRITAEISRATAAENTISAAVTAEANRAQLAENALSGRIATWETDLAAETLDRQQGDRALGLRIDDVESDLADEVTRATGAETALGGRIDDVAGDLADEVTRATGAETALGGRIDGVESDLADEVTRATGAETALGGRIDDVAGDLADFESDVADTYIPNAGNTKSDVTLSLNRENVYVDAGNEIIFTAEEELNLTARNSSLSLHSTTDDIDIGANHDIQLNAGNKINLSAEEGIILESADGAYYDDGTYNTDAEKEIVVKGDLTPYATSSDVSNDYVPNAGNTKSGGFTLIREGGASVLASKQAAGDQTSNSVAVMPQGINITTGVANDYVNKDITLTAGTAIQGQQAQGIKLMATNGNKAYYHKNGGSISGDDEIATKGDLSSYATSSYVDNGYIPNAGNTKSGNLNIVREGIHLESMDNVEVYSSQDNAEIRADQNVVIEGETVNGNDNEYNVYVAAGRLDRDANGEVDLDKTTDSGLFVGGSHVTMNVPSSDSASSVTANVLEVTNLGISGETSHGHFVPTLEKTITANDTPHDTDNAYQYEKLIYNVFYDINFIQGTTRHTELELDEAEEVIIRGVSANTNRPKISNTAVNGNSSLIILTGDITKLTFENINFVMNDITTNSSPFIDFEGNKTNVTFKNCTFTGGNNMVHNADGKNLIVFDSCIFDCDYPVDITLDNSTPNEDNIVIVKNCTFKRNVSALRLESAGYDTFIINGNDCNTIDTTYVSSNSKVIQWNNGTGASNYTETVLYTASQSGIVNTINLSEAYTNFDELVIINGDMPNSRLLTSSINLGTVNPMSNAISFSWLLGDVCASTRYVFTATNKMEFVQEVQTGSASGNNIHYTIDKIIGIKY